MHSSFHYHSGWSLRTGNSEDRKVTKKARVVLSPHSSDVITSEIDLDLREPNVLGRNL